MNFLQLHGEGSCTQAVCVYAALDNGKLHDPNNLNISSLTHHLYIHLYSKTAEYMIVTKILHVCRRFTTILANLFIFIFFQKTKNKKKTKKNYNLPTLTFYTDYQRAD